MSSNENSLSGLQLRGNSVFPVRQNAIKSSLIINELVIKDEKTAKRSDRNKENREWIAVTLRLSVRGHSASDKDA